MGLGSGAGGSAVRNNEKHKNALKHTHTHQCLLQPQDCLGRQIKVWFFQAFWPNLGPGRRPLDSDRRDAEFSGVFASVAFLTISFVPNPDFGIRSKKVKKYVQARPGIKKLALEANQLPRQECMEFSTCRWVTQSSLLQSSLPCVIAIEWPYIIYRFQMLRNCYLRNRALIGPMDYWRGGPLAESLRWRRELPPKNRYFKELKVLCREFTNSLTSEKGVYNNIVDITIQATPYGTHTVISQGSIINSIRKGMWSAFLDRRYIRNHL